ncbi:hypothetical protein [Flavobacterium salmonis]|uniref:Uncharacterized protein n=1 Tax=Flavobacterium salmonis TaxID=2654844 RepID=A0A6V6YUA7_9FLAO|nr:hypothetical protein [Flavobacterium salmonis]CAD0003108.1 hypothetical protein FLAT13_01476 [Flavobacterium salmonis]
MTKKEYFELLDKRIEEGNIALNENKIAISELENRIGDDIKNYMSILCEFCNPNTSKKSISEKK